MYKSVLTLTGLTGVPATTALETVTGTSGTDLDLAGSRDTAPLALAGARSMTLAVTAPLDLQILRGGS